MRVIDDWQIGKYDGDDFSDSCDRKDMYSKNGVDYDDGDNIDGDDVDGDVLDGGDVDGVKN